VSWGQLDLSLCLSIFDSFHSPHSLLSYPPAVMAAAVYFVTLFTLEYRDCWPNYMSDWSSLSVSDFREAAMELHRRIYMGEIVKDHRGIELNSVYDRYVHQVDQMGLPKLKPDVPPTLESLQQALDSKLQVRGFWGAGVLVGGLKSNNFSA